MSSGGKATAENAIYLHGDLDLRIIEARNFPNMDLLSEGVRRVFSVFGSCTSPMTKCCSTSVHDDGDKHRRNSHNKMITSDPYVKVCLAGATVARTRVISNSADPEWDEPTRPLPNGGDLNLGELLKYKSQEGVRVLLLVWDDKTSHDKFF